MSSNNSNFQSYSYSSSSFTSSSGNSAPQTWSHTETSSSNPQGTTIHRTSEQPGQLPTKESLQLDSTGKPVLQSGGSGGEGRARIEDVSDKDKEYEERMEEEYAKREGGA